MNEESLSIYDVLRMLIDRIPTWSNESDYIRYRNAIDVAEANRLFRQEGDFQL